MCQAIHKQSDSAAWRQSERIRKLVAKIFARGLRDSVKALEQEVVEMEKEVATNPLANFFAMFENIDWARFEQTNLDAWTKANELVLRKSTESEMGNIIRKRAIPGDEYDLQQQLAQEWLIQNGGAYATGLTNRTRSAVNEIVARGLRNGTSIETTMRNIRGVIGLTKAQSGRIIKLRRQLKKAGKTQRQIDWATNRLKGRMLRQRAKSIAITESNGAVQAGKLHAWIIGSAEGLIVGIPMKEWVTSGPCPICEQIESQGPVPLHSSWVSSVIGSIDAPPAHPNCVCTLKLVIR